MPKIDWGFYKKQVAVPGMVESFQKQFESLSVPYPQDTYTAQLDEQVKIEVNLTSLFQLKWITTNH